MKKEFILNLALLVGINLLIKPFYAFGVDLQIQNRLGSEAYGFYFALFNFSFLFQIVSDLGLQQFNNRFIAQHPYLLPKYLPRFLALKGLLALVFFVLSFLVALLIGYEAKQLQLLPFLLLNQVLITLVFYLRSNLSGLHFFRLDSLLSALDKLLMIGIMLVLLYGPWAELLKIQWFVYAQTAAYGLTALLVWLILRSKVKLVLKWRFRRAELFAILRQSWPYALAVFLMTAYTRSDAVMIERLLPAEQGEMQAGVYAFGYRLLDAFNMIGYLFAGLLLPIYARMLKQKEQIGDLLKTGYQWMAFLTLCLSICVYFYADLLSHWMLENVQPDMPEVMQLLLWTSIAVGMIYIFGSLLTANGSLKEMNRIFGIGLTLNILLNAILIPYYGAWGAAIATLITQSFVAVSEIILVFMLIKEVKKEFKWIDLFRLIGFLIGAYLLFGLIHTYLEVYLDWRLNILIAGLAALAWAEAIGFLELRGIFKLLKSKPMK
jgi:O-antigen/teichoic acid export membrane protein